MSAEPTALGDTASEISEVVSPTPPNTQIATATDDNLLDSDDDDASVSDASSMVIIGETTSGGVDVGGRDTPPVTLADVTHAMGLSIRLSPEEMAEIAARERQEQDEIARKDAAVARALEVEEYLRVERNREWQRAQDAATDFSAQRPYPFVVVDYNGPWFADVAYGNLPSGPLNHCGKDTDVWYSVTCGRYVGVLSSNAKAVKAVSGVSSGTMLSFKSQSAAVTHFNEALEDGMVSVA